MFQSLSTATASPADNGLFQLDANSADADAATPPDDWDSLRTAFLGGDSTPLGSEAFSGIIVDPADTTIFEQGESTKDDVDTDTWGHKNGSVPDKDELTNAYAAAYLAPDGGDPGTADDLILYFGADRFAVNGTANLGFWFYENQFGPDPIVAPATTGTFSGDPHSTGDLLVLSEFNNGGTVPNIQVWVWDEENPAPITCPSNIDDTTTVPCQDNDGTLKLIANSSTADCDVVPAGAVACGNVNPSEITVSWPYDAKGGGVRQGKVPAGGFFEGGVNVSQLFGGAQPCISSFLAETRSSSSIDATLKDFVSGGLPLCGANVQIAGNDINEVGDPHTFTVTANKVFAGSASPADPAHVDVTLTAANGAVPEIDAAQTTCDYPGDADGNASTDDNVDANGQCVIVFTSDTTGTVTGSATAIVSFGGQTFTVSTNGTAGNSGSVVKRFVDSKITLSPLTDTNGITENHVVTADVEVDLGNGSGFVPATVGHVDVTVTPSNGAIVEMNATGTTCDRIIPPEEPHPAGADNLDASGQCTVAFTSSVAGTVTVHATVNLSVTVGGFTEAMTRSTDGQGDNSGDATKDFVDGSLVWDKVDQDGLPLGGATFWVCQTHSWNSDTMSFVAIADTDSDAPGPGEGPKDQDSRCFVVADDETIDDPDANTLDDDDAAGKFALGPLPLGRYTVQEKSAPAGYQIDPDEVTVALRLDDPSTEANEELLDGDAGDFVNVRLFRLIVITCNTTDETLVDSTVTLPGTPGADTRETVKASQLPTGITEEALCTLPGANYDDLPGGNYDPDVELPDEAPLFTPTP